MGGKARFFLWMVVWAGLLTVPAGTAAAQAGGDLFVVSGQCLACHNTLVTPSGENVSLGSDWQASMMANASRDPYWQAAVRREVLDHPSAAEAIQDECAACHMPMSRYQARVRGERGAVFAHLPVLPLRGPMDALAADAVSCTLCHGVEAQGLGSEESFNAGFVIDPQRPAGKRPAYGPFEVPPGRARVMQSAVQVIPTQADHLRQSELCASCHTLYTQARGPEGEVIGELPEQVPYLEWLHSDYRTGQSCQSCHMPTLEEPMAISSIVGEEREGFSRHVFRGGNFLMPRIFNRHRNELGVQALPQDLDLMAERTKRHLEEEAGGIAIEEVTRRGERLQATVSLTNLAGHKLPTAYPSRRAWIHLSVRDGGGRILFESGALRPDGSIAGNDNDRDPRRFEPHYSRIDDPEQVQIYESIMEDARGEVTTGLISALRFAKDNRMLPMGFDKESAGEDIAVQGEARDDADFKGGGDRIAYVIPLNGAGGPFHIEAELWYQPIAFRWAKNLADYAAAPEARRFSAYYDGMAKRSALRLASDRRTLE